MCNLLGFPASNRVENDMGKDYEIKQERRKIVFLPLKLDNELAAERLLESPPRAGSPCPECGTGVLDYDGLLNLTCTSCRYSLTGCFS
jgi:hypothetical protein